MSKPPKSSWALDLGTTNCGVARWDAAAARPRMVELAAVCRLPGGDDHLQAPLLVPSSVHLVAPTGFLAALGRWRPFRRRLWGRHAFIGRQALERAIDVPPPEFVRTFKAALAQSPHMTLGRLEGRPVSAREVARAFLRELLREIRATTGETPAELVIAAPVDAYEGYRAELHAAARAAGIRRVRIIDEPVAAAIGYGLGLRQRRHALVVDFGAGTLDVALVTLSARGVTAGQCEVLAKSGRAIGGDLVDRWLAEEFCERLDYPLRQEDWDPRERFWHEMLVEEARRVKEAVYFTERDAFYLTPPEELRHFEARIRGDARLLEVDQSVVSDVLTRRGLYRELAAVVDEVLRDGAVAGVPPEGIDDVLLVGGSTLLPGVFAHFEERFGRDRVRAWQPFEAVAWGAAAFAAGAVSQSDFIVHDYAFVTHDAASDQPRYITIVPRGTRVPSAPDLWRGQLVPTCAFGEAEHYFKLVICELGAVEPDERRFGRDADGRLVVLGGLPAGGEGGAEAPRPRVIVPLNETSPTLGYLDPPHEPEDRRPRLEVAFGVNADRCLVATVRDLKRQVVLLREHVVVRLL